MTQNFGADQPTTTQWIWDNAAQETGFKHRVVKLPLLADIEYCSRDQLICMIKKILHLEPAQIACAFAPNNVPVNAVWYTFLVVTERGFNGSDEAINILQQSMVNALTYKQIALSTPHIDVPHIGRVSPVIWRAGVGYMGDVDETLNRIRAANGAGSRSWVYWDELVKPLLKPVHSLAVEDLEILRSTFYLVAVAENFMGRMHGVVGLCRLRITRCDVAIVDFLEVGIHKVGLGRYMVQIIADIVTQMGCSSVEVHSSRNALGFYTGVRGDVGFGHSWAFKPRVTASGEAIFDKLDNSYPLYMELAPDSVFRSSIL